MTEPSEPQRAPRDAPPTERELELDARFAELLDGDRAALGAARSELRASDDPDAGEMLQRLDALDYIDALVGQPGSELPERLGEYRITALLGRGGMGTVFEAFQESLERPVALKVLSPSFTTDPKMRRRFRTEARANATLHHQHIVPVYGFGEAAGYLYFTMERVDGVSLDKHIAAARATNRRPEPRVTARRFAGVADALSHAHRRGILHRDVKPGNILVHKDGAYALADFGLSKMLGEASISMSAHGSFLGTLHYAAPEQARGRDFSPASDLYSLGVTIFETLTNELPLYGKTTEAMLEAVLNGEPQRLLALLPRAPRDLDVVLQKLLHKEPGDRYVDAEQLARDLLRVADDEPVRIRRMPLLVKAWRRVRKHPALSTTVAIAVVLLGVVLWQWRTNAIDANETRYRELIDTATVAAESSTGDAAGPRGYLEALTGLGLPRHEASGEVSDVLLRATQLGVGGDEAETLSDAFRSDPAPDATHALLEGRGLVARRRFDERIAELEQRSGLRSREAAALMQLYRLYLGRALAHLTPALADPGAAAKDLLRASMIRRGAFFPRLLAALVEWSPASGADGLLAAVDPLLRDATPEAGRAVGALLIGVARIGAPATANLMDFGLEFGHRRALHERGKALWNAPVESAPGGPELGLEAQLRRSAVEAQRFASAPAQRNEQTERGRLLLSTDVGPDSPLRAWGTVFDLVEAPLAFTPSTDPAASELVAQALGDYLELGPDRTAVEGLRRNAESWLLALPKTSRAACRLHARFAALTASGPEALKAADAWVHADPENPDAYLCRMRCRAHEGVDAAATDAGIALQKAVDREAMRAQIVALLRAIEAERPEFAAARAEFDRGT